MTFPQYQLIRRNLIQVVQCGMTLFGPPNSVPEQILLGLWHPACGAHYYFIMMNVDTDVITMTKAEKAQKYHCL
jgi:hypothetical protein